jgi:DNA polymerase epsilon subunit 2
MLQTMLRAFNDIPGSYVFVLMGNFTSKPVLHGQDGTQQLLGPSDPLYPLGPKAISACVWHTGYFDLLAGILKECPTLCQEARFIFIPGPLDPGSGSTLPRAPLPSVFTKSLRATLQRVDFTTNPCRMRVFSQEMVFFREDILKKMLRHCIVQGTQVTTVARSAILYPAATSRCP